MDPCIWQELHSQHGVRVYVLHDQLAAGSQSAEGDSLCRTGPGGLREALGESVVATEAPGGGAGGMAEGTSRTFSDSA